MRNETIENATTTIQTTIEPAQLENVTGGCGGLGGCVNCGFGEQGKNQWQPEQQNP
jgi:hypothetical protein